MCWIPFCPCCVLFYHSSPADQNSWRRIAASPAAHKVIIRSHLPKRILVPISIRVKILLRFSLFWINPVQIFYLVFHFYLHWAHNLILKCPYSENTLSGFCAKLHRRNRLLSIKIERDTRRHPAQTTNLCSFLYYTCSVSMMCFMWMVMARRAPSASRRMRK